MDRYLDKSQDGTTVRRETPWISTIRGTATRLESLRKAAPAENTSQGKGISKSRNRYSSSESSIASSSGGEDSLVESSDDSRHHRRKPAKSKAAPRISQRLREQGSRPKYSYSSSEAGSVGSESESVSPSSAPSPPRKWQPPKNRQQFVAPKKNEADSENESSEPDYDDLMESASGSEEEILSDRETDVEEAEDLVLDKIIAKRRTSTSGSWEYLIKWRCRSYVHCEWLPGSALLIDSNGDKRSVKLKNFNSKHPGGPNTETIPAFPKGCFYNPIFETVEKIIALRHRAGSEPEYLVKWNGLPYGESTWELESDLNPDQCGAAFSEFESVNNEDRCAERMDTDSRKSAGRVLGKQFDPTVDFANTLEATEFAGEFKKPRGATVPVEYKYRPLGRSLVKRGEEPFRLFDFQKEGVSWLLYNWSQGRGCMLADEMGLGKTVQTSVTLAQMKSHCQLHRGGQLTMLIVAPLSTIEQWKREVKKWSDLEPVVYHGNRRDRNVIRKYEWNRIDVKRSKREGSETPVFDYRRNGSMMPKFDVLITTFETVSAEPEFFNSTDFIWSCIVIDEAHKLKSSEGKARSSVLAIPCRHRLLLTGTPIQNNVTELWNLLHLCSPVVWDDKEQFLAEFGNLKSAELTQRLQNKIQPFLLQRRKADVLAHLMPAKEETIVSVELTKLQKQTYRAVYEKNLSVLTGGDSAAKKNGPALTNVHMELRKVCNHPFLVQGVEDRVSHEVGGTKGDYGLLMTCLINSSGKMVFLDKLLEKLRREKSKILIFSQFTMMLDLIEDYLRWKAYEFERLDGAVKGQQRQEAIDRFNRNADGMTPDEEPEDGSFVFLLSTKAGGVGLNLTAANYVLLFDHDWNPQNDLQAQARCHRIGQKKEVMIFRLVTRGTYEEKMFQVASQKLGLEQAVMSGGGSDSKGPKLSKEEMDKLLKEGAYAMLEDDENEQKFCSENVDQILQTRAKTVSTFVESGSGIGNSFSKARFQVNEEDHDVDVNDPNFWTKMAAVGGLSALPEKTPGTEFLDYSQRKGRAQFGKGKKREGSSLESLDSEYSDAEEDDKRTSSGRAKQQVKDKDAEMRLRRMKNIMRFLLEFGIIQNKMIFENKFQKFNSDDFQGLPATAYADHLLLVIGLYLQARDNIAGSLNGKFDEIFFCPSVRAAIGLLAQFNATGESPAQSEEPLLLDSMMPDFLCPMERMDMTIPSFVPQPLPGWITEAIPRNRNPKKLILEIDQFNELRFLTRHPQLLRRIVPDKSIPADWSIVDDVALIELMIEHGKEDMNTVGISLFANRVGLLKDQKMWATNRVEKIIPKITLVRGFQLTCVIASFGYFHNIFDRTVKATGFPWMRKLACGESCLELIPGAEISHLLTPVKDLPSPVAFADEVGFYRYIIAQLPADTPISTIDVSDYSKALLFRVICVLGKKSDRHDAAVKSCCKVTKTNEYLFEGVFNSVVDLTTGQTVSGVSAVYPQRAISRMEAFKLIWRFQTLHFLRIGALAPVMDTHAGLPIGSTFIPLALSSGLDRWDVVTNLNRQLKQSDCLQSLLKFAARNLIDIDAAKSTESVVGTASAPPKKRRTPNATDGESADPESAPPAKSMKLTDFFASKNEEEKTETKSEEIISIDNQL